jgi:proline iminopeptidase
MRQYITLVLILNLTQALGQANTYQHPQGQYIKSGKYNLWVETTGKGKPIVFISGGPGGAHAGMHHFDSLASQYQLIYFDALGRGKSDTAQKVTEYTLAQDVADLEAIRKQLGYKTWTLVGHSYGSLVAQQYATSYPLYLDKLIIIGGFHSYEMWQANDDNSNHEIKTNYPEVWDTLIKVRNQGYISQDEIHQEIYSRVPYGFLYAYNPNAFTSFKFGPYPNGFSNKVYYQMVGKDGDFFVGSDIGNFDFRRELKNIKAPCLILAGRYDRVAVPYMQVKYKQYCPQATFYMFEKSGHNPQVEEATKCLQMIADFVR